jgi:catechol 2,3-dioxygenase-like lactoylglutathione lyase family enzyme
MRIRTVYFKTADLEKTAAWWSAVLGAEPTKTFPAWQEFRVGEINLGLLRIDEDSELGPQRCVPVFEFPEAEIQTRIAAAKAAGARAILEGDAHPDHPHVAAVLVDPFGNEFEFTCFRG